MATYKLIQDIEAEDHILGPLTLRQFIFALVAVFCFYISFISLAKHVAFLLVIFMPPGLFCAFFAIPFGRDQPTEIWALAKLRFLFKPRRRVWDQSGIKELVTITAPKKVEPVLTNGLSQTEVNSRLKALANTLDSRGWAIKNVAVNAYTQPDPLNSQASDRLLDPLNLPQEVPSYDVQAADDILDETSNPIARQFDTMIAESTQEHHQQLMDKLNNIREGQGVAAQQNAQQPVDYWFMHQTPAPAGLPADQAMFSNTQTVQPGAMQAVAPAAPTNADEAALAAQLKAKHTDSQTPYSHLRTIQPGGAAAPVQTDTSQQPVQITDNAQTGASGAATPDPAILSLANNDDLNVATLAREAHKAKGDEPQDEVVISLH